VRAVLAEFLGGPRDGLVTEVAVPPLAVLRLAVAGDTAARYVLVLEDDDSDRLVYAHQPTELDV